MEIPTQTISFICPHCACDLFSYDSKVRSSEIIYVCVGCEEKIPQATMIEANSHRIEIAREALFADAEEVLAKEVARLFEKYGFRVK